MLRTQPGVLAAWTVAFSMLAVGIVSCLLQWQQVEMATRAWQGLTTPRRTPPAAAGKAWPLQPIALAATLPAFNSAQLVNALNRLADESKLPLNEIAFALDANPAQPYLRYRATMSVSARYPVIRGFVEQLRITLANVSLDSITCAREDIGNTDLTCDLALSAFYRKDGRG